MNQSNTNHEHENIATFIHEGVPIFPGIPLFEGVPIFPGVAINPQAMKNSDTYFEFHKKRYQIMTRAESALVAINPCTQIATDPYRPEFNKILQDQDELNHFLGVIASFKNYRWDALAEVHRMEKNFIKLGADAQYLKEDISERVRKIKDAIILNQFFIDQIIAPYEDLLTPEKFPNFYQYYQSHVRDDGFEEVIYPYINQQAHNANSQSNQAAQQSHDEQMQPEDEEEKQNKKAALYDMKTKRQQVFESENIKDQVIISTDCKSDSMSVDVEAAENQKPANLAVARKPSDQLTVFKPKIFNGIKFRISPGDQSKVRSTLRQFVRDWTKEGEQERQLSYKPIIEEFKKYFPFPFINDVVDTTIKRRVKILLPGAGMGRLVMQFASLGYAAQGNEFSYQMLICSNFILNRVDEPNLYAIQPNIHSFSNTVGLNDAYHTYALPDLTPQQAIENVENLDFSMVAGEFVEIYQKQIDCWDSVVTCFFIDTAHNIIEYVRTIYNCLHEGGVWINFGPLLYHYAEMPSEQSIELTWEELRHVIVKVGFEIRQEKFMGSTYANSQTRSMMQTLYNCIFFTAVKVKPKVAMQVFHG